MNYYINGDKVSEDTYERDRNDNFNLSIPFTETETPETLTMEYEA